MNAKFMGKDESFDPFYGAQELLIVLANKAMPTYLYDGTLVLGNLMNAAADLGEMCIRDRSHPVLSELL